MQLQLRDKNTKKQKFFGSYVYTYKLDCNWPTCCFKFYGERNTELRAITAPSYKQPNKLELSQLQNTQLNELRIVGARAIS